jgi:hypothetical protein
MADLDVVLACVTEEPVEIVAAFVEKQKLALPVYILKGETPKLFATGGIPATFVIDRKGATALRHVGAARWDADEVVSFISGLAAQPV